MIHASRFWFAVIALALVLAALPLLAPAADAPKVKLLIVTGDDAGAHKWKETSAYFQDFMTKSGRFEVTVVEGLSCFNDKTELAKYDAIFFHMCNMKKVELSDEAKANLLNYVKDGHGFIVNHLASASFNKWDDWNKLCGRFWMFGKSGHGPRGKFDVKIIDKDNPITKGIANFTADDELYAKLLGDEKIHVLAEADSDWSKKTEPLVWTLDYGKGRVFCHTFGHDTKALENPDVQKIHLRGCEWAATGKVAE